MYLNVLAEPKVFILGHVGRSGCRSDVDAVLTAARDAHKLIEINEAQPATRSAEPDVQDVPRDRAALR